MYNQFCFGLTNLQQWQTIHGNKTTRQQTRIWFQTKLRNSFYKMDSVNISNLFPSKLLKYGGMEIKSATEWLKVTFQWVVILACVCGQNGWDWGRLYCYVYLLKNATLWQWYKLTKFYFALSHIRIIKSYQDIFSSKGLSFGTVRHPFMSKVEHYICLIVSYRTFSFLFLVFYWKMCIWIT